MIRKALVKRGGQIVEVTIDDSTYKDGGSHGGLDRWFAEEWVDIKTGKPCGRQEGENRKGYPACRPSKRVSSETPKTASELSSSEKAKFKRSKQSSSKIPYQHKRKEEGGESNDKQMVDGIADILSQIKDMTNRKQIAKNMLTDFRNEDVSFNYQDFLNNSGLPELKSGGNKPTNPALWSRAKALARSKFDVYPSAYANGWAAKWYKGKGGGWRKAQMGGEESDQMEELLDQIEDALEQGAKPEEILQQLMQMGIDQQQAQALVQQAMQDLQEDATENEVPEAANGMQTPFINNGGDDDEIQKKLAKVKRPEDLFASDLNKANEYRQPGEQYFTDWINNPETKKRLYDNLPRQETDIFDRSMYPGLTESEVRRKLKEKDINNIIESINSNIKDVKTLYNPDPVINEQLEKRYLEFIPEEERLKLQKDITENNPQAYSFGDMYNIIMRNPINDPSVGPLSGQGYSNVYTHELGHINLFDKGETSLGELLKSEFKQPLDRTKKIKASEKEELWPALMQYREANKIQPGQIVSPEDVKKFRETGGKNLLFKYYSDEEVAKYLNTVAYNKQDNSMGLDIPRAQKGLEKKKDEKQRQIDEAIDEGARTNYARMIGSYDGLPTNVDTSDEFLFLGQEADKYGRDLNPLVMQELDYGQIVDPARYAREVNKVLGRQAVVSLERPWNEMGPIDLVHIIPQSRLNSDMAYPTAPEPEVARRLDPKTLQPLGYSGEYVDANVMREYIERANDFEYKDGGSYRVYRTSERKGKTHKVVGPGGVTKYFGDPKLGERSKSKYGKKAFYARHKKNLANNPFFRAYARATWAEGGEPTFMNEPEFKTNSFVELIKSEAENNVYKSIMDQAKEMYMQMGGAQNYGYIGTSQKHKAQKERLKELNILGNVEQGIADGFNQIGNYVQDAAATVANFLAPGSGAVIKAAARAYAPKSYTDPTSEGINLKSLTGMGKKPGATGTGAGTAGSSTPSIPGIGGGSSGGAGGMDLSKIMGSSGSGGMDMSQILGGDMSQMGTVLEGLDVSSLLSFVRGGTLPRYNTAGTFNFTTPLAPVDNLSPNPFYSIPSEGEYIYDGSPDFFSGFDEQGNPVSINPSSGFDKQGKPLPNTNRQDTYMNDGWRPENNNPQPSGFTPGKLGISSLAGPMNAVNMLAGIASQYTRLGNRKKEEELERDMADATTSDNTFAANEMLDRGDFDRNTGRRKPDQYIMGTTQGIPALARYGGNLRRAKQGGVQKDGVYMSYPTATPESVVYGEEPKKPSNTLRPIKRELANLEAELGETAVLRAKDGLPKFVKIGGKRHSNGGTPLNLPDGSFIFSDTKSMKLGKNILEELGIKGEKKRTPAEVSKILGKGYENFVMIIQDPKSDPIERRTAELMIENQIKKLGQLALAQESKKGFPDGIPMIAVPYMESVGIAPEQILPQPQTGMEEMNMPQQMPQMQMQQMGMPMARYGMQKYQVGTQVDDPGYLDLNTASELEDLDSNYTVDRGFGRQIFETLKNLNANSNSEEEPNVKLNLQPVEIEDIGFTPGKGFKSLADLDEFLAKGPDFGFDFETLYKLYSKTLNDIEKLRIDLIQGNKSLDDYEKEKDVLTKRVEAVKTELATTQDEIPFYQSWSINPYSTSDKLEDLQGILDEEKNKLNFRAKDLKKFRNLQNNVSFLETEKQKVLELINSSTDDLDKLRLRRRLTDLNDALDYESNRTTQFGEKAFKMVKPLETETSSSEPVITNRKTSLFQLPIYGGSTYPFDIRKYTYDDYVKDYGKAEKQVSGTSVETPRVTIGSEEVTPFVVDTPITTTNSTVTPVEAPITKTSSVPASTAKSKQKSETKSENVVIFKKEDLKNITIK
jgi:hypothetical protein